MSGGGHCPRQRRNARNSGSPITATTGIHWTKSYKNGFGRDKAIEAGYGTTVVSHVENVYGPCACSPPGKLTQASAPYAIGSGGITARDGTSNIAWTTWAYDGLGRTLTQASADSSTTTYLYSGNTTKVTDPTGKWKRFTSDVLGNLVKVEEPGASTLTDSGSTNYATNYTYDLWGHVTGVSMPRPNGGGTYTQTRTFSYDVATGRLTSAANPESGTISYFYYTSGRLKQKTVAKGQKVIYSYDGYGRLKYIDRYQNGAIYYDPCQSVELQYDSGGESGSTNLLGRVSRAVTGPCNSSAPKLYENFSYTAGGLMVNKGYDVEYPDFWDGAGNYNSPYHLYAGTNFSWDTEGRMTGYGPFAYSLNGMGRPVALTETGPGTVWAQSATYGPGGEMTALSYRTNGGTYYAETRSFNNRNQLTGLAAAGSGLQGLSLAYGYASGTNNGQITTMTDALSGEQVTYTYDSLKRLTRAETTHSQTTYPSAPWWGQSFGYDGFGNLATKSATAGHSGTTMSLTMDPATNRPTTSGFTFDANGNMTGMPATPSNLSLSYDIENRTGGTFYDQNNQPLDRAGVWNVYGLRGERLATYTFSLSTTIYNTGSYLYLYRLATPTQTSRNIYFGGRLIQSNGQTVLTDRLGSVRADASGAKAVYYPYGEQQSGSMGDGKEKFATYTRESATGLDYANQRFYASTYGRFNTADPYRASAGAADPGSWNRYAYVVGDPAGRFDATGLDYTLATGEAFNPGDPRNVNGTSITVSAGLPGIPCTGSLGGGLGSFGSADIGRDEGICGNPLDSWCVGSNVDEDAELERDWETELKLGIECIASATANQDGITAAAVTAGVLGAPIPKSWLPPFREIGTPYTTILSSLGHYFQATIPRAALFGLGTTNLLRYAGRLAGPASVALFAYDLASIGFNSALCYSAATSLPKQQPWTVRRNPMDYLEAVIRFVAEKTGVHKERLGLDTRLLQDLGVEGDDAGELLDAFGDVFGVDLSKFPYDRYFGSEPSMGDPLWFLPRRRRMRMRKPALTIRMLSEAAARKTWDADATSAEASQPT